MTFFLGRRPSGRRPAWCAPGERHFISTLAKLNSPRRTEPPTASDGRESCAALPSSMPWVLPLMGEFAPTWAGLGRTRGHAACFAFTNNCARAFFPALLAFAMLAKKPDEDWIGPTGRRDRSPTARAPAGSPGVSRRPSSRLGQIVRILRSFPIDGDGRINFQITSQSVK